MIGKYRQRVTLERKQRTSDGGGGWTTEWVRYGASRCFIAPLSGREVLAGNQLEAAVTTRVVMPFRKDITAADRVVYQGTPYNIVSVINVNQLSKDLELLCEEGTAQLSTPLAEAVTFQGDVVTFEGEVVRDA